MGRKAEAIDAMEITCVIPAFERLDLLARCLASVCCQDQVRVEVIVTDDSQTNAIRDFTATMASAFPFIRYLEGPRSGNPVDNWNHGLDHAGVDLLLLVHQDEFLLDPRYLRRAVDAMSATGVAAVLGHTAVIDVTRPSRFASVAPLARRLPRPAWFLPMINWIGPTAAFVFKGAHRFDRTLVQLVDVEFYRRVLATGKLATLSGVCVGSLGHQGRITARIDPAASALTDLRTLAGRTPRAIGPIQHAASALAVTLRAWSR